MFLERYHLTDEEIESQGMRAKMKQESGRFRERALTGFSLSCVLILSLRYILYDLLIPGAVSLRGLKARLFYL